MKNEKQAINYITGQIHTICKTFRNRCGGSPSEQGCQRHFLGELSKYADETREEAFTFHPKAFMGWIVPCAILDLLCVALYWLRLLSPSVLIPIAGFAAIALSLFAFVFEFFLYRRFTDGLYSKATSSNVYAARKPRGEVRRRIIFGGHADAAYEMTFTRKGRVKWMFAALYGAVAGVVYLFLLSGVALVSAIVSGPASLTGAGAALGIVGVGFVPFFIATMFFINWNKIVDGANDNLTGCLVSMSVLREMFIRGERLEHTEVCCLITGCEEEGLRGAAAFAKANKKEFKQVETIYIAVETLREIGQLKVYTRGINGTQKNSEEVGKLLSHAGRRRGFHLPVAGWYPGATDAEAFSREGIAACGLCGVDHTPQPYYHTRHDNPSNLDEGCIKAALDVCLETVRLYDALGELLAPESHQSAAVPHRESIQKRAAQGVRIVTGAIARRVPATLRGMRKSRAALAFSHRP